MLQLVKWNSCPMVIGNYRFQCYLFTQQGLYFKNEYEVSQLSLIRFVESEWTNCSLPRPRWGSLTFCAFPGGAPDDILNGKTWSLAKGEAPTQGKRKFPEKSEINGGMTRWASRKRQRVVVFHPTRKSKYLPGYSGVILILVTRASSCSSYL